MFVRTKNSYILSLEPGLVLTAHFILFTYNIQFKFVFGFYLDSIILVPPLLSIFTGCYISQVLRRKKAHTHV